MGEAAGGAHQRPLPLPLSVLPIELLNVTHAGGQVTLRLPGVTLCTIAPPPDQVLHLPLPAPSPVQDPLHLRDTRQRHGGVAGDVS